MKHGVTASLSHKEDDLQSSRKPKPGLVHIELYLAVNTLGVFFSTLFHGNLTEVF